VDEQRPLQTVPRLELREQAVDVVDVLGALDLGDHHHVELVADRLDDLREVVEGPRAVEAVDARPQLRRAEVVRAPHLDQPAPRRDLLGCGNRVLEVAEQDVDLRDDLTDSLAHALVLRREEVDHPRRPHGDLARRVRRADGERLEEVLRTAHGASPVSAAGGPSMPGPASRPEEG
jgi:hypothetical protein